MFCMTNKINTVTVDLPAGTHTNAKIYKGYMNIGLNSAKQNDLGIMCVNLFVYML